MTQQLEHIQCLAPALVLRTTQRISWNTPIETSSHSVLIGQLPVDSSRLIKISPKANQAAISFFIYENVEVLTFPWLFWAESCLSKAKRKVAVGYSTIELAELRSQIGPSRTKLLFEGKKIEIYRNIAIQKRSYEVTANVVLTNAINGLFKSDTAYSFTISIRISPELFSKLQSEFFAMVTTFGLPTLFTTFSMSENRWADLRRLLYQSTNPDRPNLSDEKLLNFPYNDVNDLNRGDHLRIVIHFVKKLKFVQNTLF